MHRFGWIASLYERLVLALTVMLLVFVPLQGIVRAIDTEISWLAGDPTMRFSDLPSDYVVPYSLNYNTDCDSTDFNVVIREVKTAPKQTELRYRSACAVATPRGMTDGVYLEAGMPAGPFTDVNGAPVSVARIPNSSTLLSLQSNAGLLNGYFFESLAPVFNATTGEVQYRMSPAVPIRLADGAGNRYFLRGGSIGYSDNGQWMVAESTVGFIRVNLATRAVTPFAPPLNYNSGFDPAPRVAISDDGQYAVVASRTNLFKLFNLESCGAAPATVTGPVACQSKDMQPSLAAIYPTYTGSQYIRFASADLITFVAGYADSSVNKRVAVRMAPAGRVIEDVNYLALGDSFSSGEGAFEYEQGTDNTDPRNKCHLSTKSYPYLAAQTLAVGSFHSVACSGAITSDYEESQDDQNRVFDSPLGIWLPGYRAQSEGIDDAHPSVVTLSMIGNDIGFSSKITRCIAGPDSCFHFREDRQSIAEEIRSKFDDLVDLYNSIKADAPGVKLYVMGYPQLISASGGCGLNVSLDTEEREMAHNLIIYLNAVIKAAVQKAGVRYINVEDAFTDHRLCEPGAKAVDGLTAGDDKVLDIGPIGNESFHPNQLGHQLLANALISQSQQFTVPMPASDDSVTAPGPSSPQYSGFLGSAPSGSRLVRIAYVGGDTIPGVIKGGVFHIDIPASQYLPSYVFEAWFNSEPTFAGTLSTDANGELHGEITVPRGLAPGFHTLHLYGKDLANKDIDLYQTVYVTVTQNDFDGDDIANEDEKCLAVEPANVDFDKDGIDDACDPEITDPPADTLPPIVTVQPDREPNADGWYNNDVVINWLVDDPEPSSGAPTQPEPVTADIEGEHTYTSNQACDPLNNCANGSITLRIDKTPPNVRQIVSPGPNDENWHSGDVIVESLCNDSLSGVLDCSPSVTLSAEGANQVVQSRATDKAGNTATASTVVNIDKTAPQLGAAAWTNNPKSVMGTAAITIPATDNISGIAEAEYFLGDSDPGLGNGATMQVNNDSISVGFNTDFPTGVFKVTVRVKDKAGNWSTGLSDYLVVYDPFGTHLTGKRILLPSLSNGDILPGLVSADQQDRAKFGFNVRYNKDGDIHRNSDFQFKYETGTKCANPAKAQNCHRLELNATSIFWLTTQGANDSTGIFQGAAKLTIDGVTTDAVFRLTGLDGERLNDSSPDHLLLKVYPEGMNLDTADPIYEVNADVLRGSIKIRKFTL